MHKIGFLGHPMGASGAMYALYLKFLTERNLVTECVINMTGRQFSAKCYKLYPSVISTQTQKPALDYVALKV